MTIIKFKIFIIFFILTFLVCMFFFALRIKKEFKQHKLFQEQLDNQIQLETKKLNSLEEKIVLSDRLTQSMQNNMFEVCKELLQIIKMYD